MKDLIFGNPQRGIKSPHFGISDLRCADIHSEPGVLKINEKAQSRTNSVRTRTFTANASTDVITTSSTFAASTGESTTGTAVTLTTTGTLPAGLSTGTTYFLIPVNGTTTFKLATSYANADAGTAINITDAGTGTHTITSIEVGIPQNETTDPRTGYSFMVDDTGRVWTDRGGTTWRLLDGNTRTNANGNGIQAAFNFLFVFRNALIDVCDISTTAKIDDPVGQSAWTNGWKTLNTASGTNNPHRTFVKDGVIYYGDDRYVGSIEQLTTFAPGTGATYTWTQQHLDLPDKYIVGPLSELGDLLIVGAYQEEAGFSHLFPWDTESASYERPITVPAKIIRDIQNIVNTLYIAAGDDGAIYSSVGTVAPLFIKIPGHQTNIPGSNKYARVRRLEYFRNRLFFSLDCNSAYESGKHSSGVWSVNLDGSGLCLEFQISSGSYGTTSGVFVPLLHKPSDANLHIGWQDADASSSGLDSVGEGTFAYYGSYAASVIFDLTHVGSVRLPFTPEFILFQLTKALESGQGVRLSYRTNTNSSFTTIGTYDFSTLGAVLSHFDSPGILSAEILEIKAELTTSGQTTPKLKFVSLA